MNKRNLAIVGVVLLALIAGVFWYNKNKQKQSDKQIVQQDSQEIKERESDDKQEKEKLELEEIDISNWKTYVNKEYGFEVKYPEEWEYDLIDGVTFGDKKNCERDKIDNYWCRELINFSKYSAFKKSNGSYESVFEWRVHDFANYEIKNQESTLVKMKNINLDIIKFDISHKDDEMSYSYYFIDKDNGKKWEITLRSSNKESLLLLNAILNSMKLVK